NGNRFKLIKYDYDLISGKVNQVSYQPGQADGFYHQYSYDAENRITGVRTSTDSVEWQDDAQYTYYRHGPLARVQLGSLQVQGMDYAYTVQGWLKSVNPSWITPSGLTDQYDGDGTSTVALLERDAYKFNLHYYDDGTYTDYTPVAPPSGYAQGSGIPGAQRRNLYNGNISTMGVNIRPLASGSSAYAGPLLYNYGYDQLNRIDSMDAWAANGSFAATGTSPLTDFAERFGYDPNGNILALSRNGTTGNGGMLTMDNLSYKYLYAKSGGGVGEYIPGQTLPGDMDHLTNQLSSIQDGVSSSNYTTDIDNQSAFNYQYDAIGNLTADVQSGITGVTWSVYGKILSITNSSGTISYTYDASGNRISKTAGGITTWYVRDASGNVMSVYTQGDGSKNSGALTQSEAHVYGSSRLGILNLMVNCTSLAQPTVRSLVRGNKLFELPNHLGNVLVTISDKKLQHTTDGSTVDYYTADAISANDYYAFGSPMPGRAMNTTGYRYGFNGKEKDDEVKGDGDQIDYGMRVYDPRVGRFLSVDPLSKSYAQLTPYQYSGNSPISGIDLDGKEFNWFMLEWAEKKLLGTTHLQKMRQGAIEQAAKDVSDIYNGIKDFINKKGNSAPIYGNGTTLTGGIPPGFKMNMDPGTQLGMQVFKGVAKEYGDLIAKAFSGNDKAVGAAAFEVAILFLPGPEEAKELSLLPRGFKDAEQFSKVGEELTEALNKSGIKFKEIGVAGSSVTGVSSKGGEFREIAENGMKASDIDVFIVLDEDIPIKGGVRRPDFIHPDKLLKQYPALREWSEKWSEILKREITPAAIKPEKPPTN
ncbi:MAG TPA: RHS repeat-associated core domain-containing protein, partial [Puia sp.]